MHEYMYAASKYALWRESMNFLMRQVLENHSDANHMPMEVQNETHFMSNFSEQLIIENGTLLDAVNAIYSPIFDAMTEAIIKVSESDPQCLNFMRDRLKEVIIKVNHAYPENHSPQMQEILRNDTPRQMPVVSLRANNELHMERNKRFLSVETVDDVPAISLSALN